VFLSYWVAQGRRQNIFNGFAIQIFDSKQNFAKLT
jgi:hypothetical protein